MSRRWVTDASPLIVLARLGSIQLLPGLADELIIPGAVGDEVLQGAEDDPARSWLVRSGRPYVAAAVPLSPVVAAWDLGRGENAVLSWACEHPGWVAVVDDRAAREPPTSREPAQHALAVAFQRDLVQPP